MMKRIMAVLLTVLLLSTAAAAFAEDTTSGDPPDMPTGEGGEMGDPPDGMGGGDMGSGGMPGGGQSGQPSSYTAVYSYDSDAEIDGEAIASTGSDESAILVSGGTVTVSDVTVDRTSSDSTGGDSSSFYGVGAALLATSGTLKITNSTITTNSSGGAGVFAYGDSVVYVSDTTITTEQGTSGGIHAAGGGTLYASNLMVETSGASSAAIRSDRGGGLMVVDGGTYIANGSGSPAIYCTADIYVNNATLTATGSEAFCLEGLNTTRLYNCDLSGDMPDSSQSDIAWNVIVYQSMSGDAEVGKGTFEMVGGSLTAENGGMFYTTNTESEFILSGVEIIPSEDNDFFLRCSGNANQRGWGTTGANGADCTFTGIGQEMTGDVIWDSISQLDLYLTSGSVLTGAVIDDESYAGDGGSGYCSLYIDENSSWIVTGSSVLTNLYNAGTITDAEGNAVSIVDSNGEVLVEGVSAYTITVTNYSTACDLSDAGTATDWSDYAVSFE